MFTAVRGQGAFLNGKPISGVLLFLLVILCPEKCILTANALGCEVSVQKSLGNALLATGVGTKRDKARVDMITNRINSLLYKV